MSNSPRTSRPRYQKIRELGHNREGGRVTYLAKDNATGLPVVIKQFQFAQSGSDLAGFKAYEREIQILRSFNHPGIPRYLNSFETSQGFCMVQEYKEAESLAVLRQWTPEEIKQIAISVLEILIYLQNRIPPVIHRDIKPENILVDDQMNVYLVDFGFARIGSAEGAMSSVAAGTFGFMAPEQIYNRELSNATDLYALGATLICLLTQTRSTEVETLLDDTGRFNFKPKVSKLNRGFINWLEKMVQLKQKDRYASAAEAKEALIPLSFNVVPEVHLSQSSLKFKATEFGEKVTETIIVTNPILQTVLEGQWKVAAHPNDPPHTSSTHDWISFSPNSFKRNEVGCFISVDTSNLILDKVYNREILLQTNSEPKTHHLRIEVQTASLASLKIPWLALIVASLLLYISSPFVIDSRFAFHFLYDWRTYELRDLFLINLRDLVDLRILEFIILIGAIVLFYRGYEWGIKKGLNCVSITGFLSLFLVHTYWGTLMYLNPCKRCLWNSSFWYDIIAKILVITCVLIIGTVLGFLVKEHRKAGFKPKTAMQISILETVLGSGFSIGSLLGLYPSGYSLKLLLYSLWQLLVLHTEDSWFTPISISGFIIFIILEIVGISWLLTMEILEYKKLINQYRKSEPHRIKP